jgi:hypothetical protein
MDETIELWSDNPYNNPILNRVWETFPGFLMWNVWKERNRRIFKDKMLTRAQLWEIISINVKESISVVPWSTKISNWKLPRRSYSKIGI